MFNNIFKIEHKLVCLTWC